MSAGRIKAGPDSPKEYMQDEPDFQIGGLGLLIQNIVFFIHRRGDLSCIVQKVTPFLCRRQKSAGGQRLPASRTFKIPILEVVVRLNFSANATISLYILLLFGCTTIFRMFCISNFQGSDLNLCTHQFCELADDGGVAGPCRSGDEVAVDNSLVYRNFNIGSAGKCDVRTDCGICGCLITLEDTGCSKDLRAVADCRDGFFGCKEFAHDFQDTRIQADVFRCAAAGNEQAFVVFGFDSIKVSCQSKVVASEFCICLLAEEVMDCSCNGFSRLLVRADSIYLISEDAQRLERNHSFIIFRKITA